MESGLPARLDPIQHSGRRQRVPRRGYVTPPIPLRYHQLQCRRHIRRVRLMEANIPPGKRQVFIRYTLMEVTNPMERIMPSRELIDR